MERSESIVEITTALHKFQKDVGKVAKDATNPFFKSKYATLNQVWETIQPVLSKNGLAVVQLPDADGLTTIISHTSGEYLQTTATLPNISDPQKHGGSITYMRRYALAGLGLVIDEDDDANAATEAVRGSQEKPKPGPKRTLTKGKAKWT